MIGGIFIKANNPKFLARWYEDNLGIGFGTGVYFSFKWRDIENSDEIGYTVFSFFANDTDYFYPGTADSMLNIRVKDLDTLRIQLQKNGVEVLDNVEDHPYGRFGWALDCDGNKIELWEPVDKGFDDFNKEMDLFGKVTGLGGVFLKCKDPDKSASWYRTNLGFDFTSSYCNMEWKDLNNRKVCNTVLSFLPMNSNYFGTSKKDFIINFRVKDLDSLLKELRTSEVEIEEKTETYDYGKFGWVYDPEGNRIELWEPTA